MGFSCSPEPITTTGMRCRSTAHQPLLKFIYLGCPAFDLSENRPLPGVVSDALRPAPATAPTRSALVVSHHLDGLLRFRARIYCNTIPNRVHCVSPPNLLSPKAETSSTDDSRIPTAQFTPLEEFPSPAAVPCHHGRCHSRRLPTHQAFPRLLRCQVSQTPTKTPDDTSQNHMLKEHRFGRPAAYATSVRRPRYIRLPLHAGPPKRTEPTPKCWSFPVDFRALLHRRVRTVWTVSSTATAYPSMGFVPLQGAALSDSCPPPHGDRDARLSLSFSRYTASLLWFHVLASKPTNPCALGVYSSPQFSTGSSYPLGITLHRFTAFLGFLTSKIASNQGPERPAPRRFIGQHRDLPECPH